MYPNNFNIPFYANYNNPMIGLRMTRGLGPISRSSGFLSRLTGGIKGINLQGILNNTSRTLNVINQAIPIVKQVGPMYNNMKSMLKVASLFKDETEPIQSKNKTSTQKKKTNIKERKDIDIKKETENNKIIQKNYDNAPSFFI